MKEEVAEKLFKERGIVNIPVYKKVWYSITKFEKYPEMAAEGVGKAFAYLAFLMIIFAIVISIATVIAGSKFVDRALTYLDNEISTIKYENSNMEIKLKNEKDRFITEYGTVIVNTDSTTTDEKMVSNEIKVIFLKDRVIVGTEEAQNEFNYKDLFDELGIASFDKSAIINLINNEIITPRAYVSAVILVTIAMFIAYFIATLSSILLLSIFGMLTSWIAGIKIRYRAVFNMSIYAITISAILQMIYITVNMFTNFEIKYFDLMYTAIAYICLTAAIFMIKSDVIKQHIEMMKIMQNQENKPEEKQEQKEEQEENKEEKKEEEKQDEKQEKTPGEIDGKVEGEGSNA